MDEHPDCSKFINDSRSVPSLNTIFRSQGSITAYENGNRFIKNGYARPTEDICINDFFVVFTYFSRALGAGAFAIIFRQASREQREERVLLDCKDHSGRSFRKKAPAVCLPSSCHARLR